MEKDEERNFLQLYGLIEQANRKLQEPHPFSLAYGTETVIPIDLVRPIMKLAEIVEIPREDILEIVEEKCDNVAFHNRLYQESMKVRHEGQVKERKFQV